MRAFVAIRPCEAARDALLSLQEDLNQGRAVPEENLHVTLAFLDDQPTATLEALHEALSCIRVGPVALTFSGVEARGGRKPALIWAGVETTERLTLLHSRVRSAARAAGIVLPRTRFRPHATLARISRAARIDHARLAEWMSRHGTFRSGPFPVKTIRLYRSDLGPGGPTYEVLAEYPLAIDGSVSLE